MFIELNIDVEVIILNIDSIVDFIDICSQVI